MKYLRKIVAIIFCCGFFSGFSAAEEEVGDFKQMVLGVIVSTDSNKSIALVKNKSTNVVNAFKLGGKLDAKTVISKIGRKQIEIKNNGKTYILAVGAEQGYIKKEFDPTTNVSYSGNEIEKSGNSIRLSSTYKEHLIKNKLSEILMQAATEIAVQDGRVIGFRIFEITPGSIYEKTGFQNGDVVTHINGQEVNDAGVAIRTLNQIKSSNDATIRVLRAGRVEEIKIQAG